MADNAGNDDSFARRQACAHPRKATSADREMLVRTLTRAFAKDPVFDWFLRPDKKRDAAREAFFDFFITSLALPTNETWMPDDGAAAAIWMPPSGAGMNLSVVQELKLLPRLIFMTGGWRMGRTAKIREALGKHHPTAPDHWYLGFIGVDPARQGKGLGSTLLESHLKRVDAERLPAYLEASSPDNMKLYLRHGFQVREEFRAAPDAPPMWAMWREPKLA